MTCHRAYDHIFLVTNDLNTDRRLQRICQTLCDEGRKVLLLGCKKDNSSALQPRDYDQQRIETWFSYGPSFYAEVCIRQIGALRYIQSRTLTCCDEDTLMVGRWMAQYRPKTKLFFDAHELFIDVPELEGKRVKKWIWKNIALHSLPYFSTCYTVNHSLAQLLKNRYAKDFDVIMNCGSPPITTQTINRHSKFTIVYLGVLNKGRGLEYIIEAMNSLPNMQLWIIGEGDCSESLRQQANGITNITFWGVLSPHDFHPLLAQSHVGINLLDPSSRSYYYSLANKFFDYVHHDLWVLTMDFPEYRNLNEQYNCATLLPNLDTESIISTIKKIHHQYDQLLAGRLPTLKTELSWSSQKTKLLTLYHTYNIKKT